MKIVLCNCSPAEAAALARAVVDGAVAACVNIVPGVTSVYWWDGKVCEDAECTLLIKTSDDKVAALSDRLRALHSYETPEIVVLDVDDAASDPRYLAWVHASTHRLEPQ